MVLGPDGAKYRLGGTIIGSEISRWLRFTTTPGHRPRRARGSLIKPEMSANVEVVPTPRRDPDTLVLSEDPLHVSAELRSWRYLY